MDLLLLIQHQVVAELAGLTGTVVQPASYQASHQDTGDQAQLQQQDCHSCSDVMECFNTANLPAEKYTNLRLHTAIIASFSQLFFIHFVLTERDSVTAVSSHLGYNLPTGPSAAGHRGGGGGGLLPIKTGALASGRDNYLMLGCCLAQHSLRGEVR